MSVEFYRETPGKFDSRTLSRKTLSRWTGRINILSIITIVIIMLIIIIISGLGVRAAVPSDGKACFFREATITDTNKL